MSTIQSLSSVKQPGVSTIAMPEQSSQAQTANVTVTATTRTEQAIRRDIEAIERSLRDLERERSDLTKFASVEAQKRALILSASATTQEIYDEDRRLADEQRKQNGEESDGPPSLVNPMRMLSIGLQTKILVSLRRLEGLPADVSRMQSQLDSLYAELRSVLPPIGPRA